MEAGGRDGIDVSVWPAIMFAYGILAIKGIRKLTAGTAQLCYKVGLRMLFGAWEEKTWN